jgi:hypothetical protein
MADITIREASTAAIPFQLLEDNAPCDLSSVNKVEIVLVPANGTGTAISYNTTTHPTVLAISSAALGKVAFTPNGTTDLTYANTPYKVFFWVFTSPTAKYAVPDQGEFSIEVTNDFV